MCTSRKNMNYLQISTSACFDPHAWYEKYGYCSRKRRPIVNSSVNLIYGNVAVRGTGYVNGVVCFVACFPSTFPNKVPSRSSLNGHDSLLSILKVHMALFQMQHSDSVSIFSPMELFLLWLNM